MGILIKKLYTDKLSFHFLNIFSREIGMTGTLFHVEKQIVGRFFTLSDRMAWHLYLNMVERKTASARDEFRSGDPKNLRKRDSKEITHGGGRFSFFISSGLLSAKSGNAPTAEISSLVFKL